MQDLVLGSSGLFSFTYSLYVYEYDSPVGASCARDLAKKTFTCVNQNQDRSRKLNRPVRQLSIINCQRYGFGFTRLVEKMLPRKCNIFTFLFSVLNCSPRIPYPPNLLSTGQYVWRSPVPSPDSGSQISKLPNR